MSQCRCCTPDRRRRHPALRLLLCASGSRSEEHTSELQSQSNLVCRLLLEKKNNSHTHTRLCLNNGGSGRHNSSEYLPSRFHRKLLQSPPRRTSCFIHDLQSVRFCYILFSR